MRPKWCFEKFEMTDEEIGFKRERMLALLLIIGIVGLVSYAREFKVRHTGPHQDRYAAPMIALAVVEEKRTHRDISNTLALQREVLENSQSLLDRFAKSDGQSPVNRRNHER